MNIFTATFVEAIKKGLISLAWRLGCYLIAGLLALLTSNIGALNLSPTLIAIIGVALGEITKQFNTWQATKLGVAKRLGANNRPI